MRSFVAGFVTVLVLVVVAAVLGFVIERVVPLSQPPRVCFTTDGV